MRAKLFISIALLVVALDTISAGPVPAVTLSVPDEVLINEDFTFTVTFSNTGGTVGYGPFIDLVLPAGGIDYNDVDPSISTHPPGPCDGVTYVPGSAQMVKVNGGPIPLATDVVLAPCTHTTAGACATIPHPYAANGISSLSFPNILVPEGAQLVTIKLPFGMFQPNQPNIVIKVTAHVSDHADVNAPLRIYARAGFQFGGNPANDPALDPPLNRLSVGGVSNCTTWTASAPVTPVLFTFKVEDRLSPNPGPCFDGVDNGQDDLTDSDDPDCKDGKAYEGPENETATGPNFPRRYKIILNIANNMTVTNLNVQDCIPNNMVVTSAVSTAPVPTSISPPPPLGPVNSPNNCMTFSYSSITGGASATDVVIEVEFYIPEKDANGVSILGTNCKVAHSINDVKAEGDWIPIDPRDWGGSSTPVSQHVTSDTSSQDHDLSDKCIAIQKSVKVFTDTGAHGPTPGDTLRYEMDFQISDFKTVGDLKVEDFLSDGQQIALGGPLAPTLTVTDQAGTTSGTFVLNTDLLITNASQNPPCPCPDKGTKLTFQVSTKMINLVPPFPRHAAGVLTGGYAVPGTPSTTPATGRIVFYAKILDQFSNNYSTGDRFVDKDDPLINCVTIKGVLRKNIGPLAVVLGPIAVSVQDDSKTAIAIVTDTIKKSVYAIKRGGSFICGPSGTACLLPPAAPDVHPGDEVTFRIEKTIPSSDAEKLTIQDWPPLPAFNIAGISFNNATCGIPGPPNNGCLGPFDTLNLLVTPKPNFSANVGANSIKFDYSTFKDSNNQPRTIDLLFTSTVTNQPFADGLYLTNEAQECEKNTFGVQFCQTAIAGVNLREPALVIRKGVIATDNPNGQFSSPGPPPTSNLATAPAPPGVTFNLNGVSGGSITSPLGTFFDSNLSNVDANDKITYAIVIENQGGHPAFDVNLTDTIPSCLTNVTAITVKDGTSAILPTGSFTIIPAVPTTNFTFSLIAPASIPANSSAANGTNIIVITFQAQLRSNVMPGCCDNVAKLTHYASQHNGPDFVGAGFTPPFQDSATVCVKPVAEKCVKTTSEVTTQADSSSTGSPQPPQLTPGEIVRFRLKITLPEGVSPFLTLVDRLPTGLTYMNDGTTNVAFVSTGGLGSITSSVLSGPGLNVNAKKVVCAGPTPIFVLPAAQISGGPVFISGAAPSFNLGTVTNTHNDPNLEFVIVEFNALVNNLPPNPTTPGAPIYDGALLGNYYDVYVGKHIGNPTPIATSPITNIKIVEPKLDVQKTYTPPNPNSAAYFTVTVTNTGTADAFDVHLTDILPSGLTLSTSQVPSVSVAPAGCAVPTLNVATPSGVTTLTVDVPRIPVLPSCATTLKFWVQGQFCGTNTAQVSYSSLPGGANSHPAVTAAGTQPNNTGSITPCQIMTTQEDCERIYNASGQASNNVACCAPQPPEMLSWWRLDETSGNTVVDYKNGHNGTTSGNIGSDPTVTSPKVVSALFFTNANASVPGGFYNFGTGNFSVDAWVKGAAHPTTSLGILYKLDTAASPKGFAFFVGASNNCLQFTMGNGTSSPATFTSNPTFSYGPWQHVAVTVQRTGGSPIGKFYINGAQAGTFTPPATSVNNSIPLLIGSYRPNGAGCQSCEVALDEIEIFDGVVSLGDIKAIYDAGSAGKCP
jgi:uncharacterized repeat protein (TIGR01451 family)